MAAQTLTECDDAATRGEARLQMRRCSNDLSTLRRQLDDHEHAHPDRDRDPAAHQIEQLSLGLL